MSIPKPIPYGGRSTGLGAKFSSASLVIFFFFYVFMLPSCAFGSASTDPDKTNADRATSSTTGCSASLPLALPDVAPTRFRFMSVRFVLAQQAVAGYERSGVPLVGFNGTKFTPAGEGDDLGVYYFIPKVVTDFHLSVATSIDLFIVTLIVFPLLVGLTGLYLLVRGQLYSLWGTVALCGLAAISARYGDVYVVQAGIVVALVPWILYLAGGRPQYSILAIFAFTCGIVCSLANILRFQASTPFLVFAVIILLFQVKSKLSRRIFLLVALFIGALVPQLYFHRVLSNRDRFLLAMDRCYVPAVPYHPVWHNVYTGLGFLNNPYGLVNKDESAIEKVRTIAPHALYPSFAYEQAVKGEVFRTIKAQPGFVLYGLMVKMGLLLLIGAICCGPGLIAAVRYPKPWPIECAFWSAMLIASLNGILVEPRAPYLLGFIALCVLYGFVSLEWRNRNTAGQAVAKYEPLSLNGVPSRVAVTGAAIPLGWSTAAEGSPPRPKRQL
jgi:hypothetical protein